jgi:hypothetical protein
MITITPKHIPKLRELSTIVQEIFDIRKKLKDSSLEMATIAELTNALKEKTAEYEATKKETFSNECSDK